MYLIGYWVRRSRFETAHESSQWECGIRSLDPENAQFTMPSTKHALCDFNYKSRIYFFVDETENYFMKLITSKLFPHFMMQLKSSSSVSCFA